MERKQMTIKTIGISAIYIAAITTANILVSKYGPAITIINAFAFIGLDLALRDYLHDAWQARRALKMSSLILIAGAVSYIANPAAGRIAVASLVAFIIAAGFDWLVYHRLREHAWFKRANASNTAGALADSIAFPILAFGWPPMIGIMIGQFVAKALGGLVWTTIIGAARAATRNNRPA
jgi:uncharacterized PurR-regulated membrane protein YhhQ (DUF165 family)